VAARPGRRRPKKSSLLTAVLYAAMQILVFPT
jgi:hypothetical protein